MRYIYRNGISEKCIWLLTTALFANFTIFDQSNWGSAILLAITAAIFVLDAAQDNGKIVYKIEGYHIHVFLFALYCGASCLWAWSPLKAIQSGITIFEILICMSVLYAHYAKQKNVAPLMDAVMWAGYAVTIYTFVFAGFSTIRMVMLSGSRLDNSFTNINSIGMVAAVSFILTVHNILFVEDKLRWRHLFIIPVLVMVAISGSRKTLVMSAMGAVLLIMDRYRSRNIMKTVLRWIILAVFILAAFTLLLSLPMFGAVKARMTGLIAVFTGTGQVDSSSMKRMLYIQIGLEQFKRTPFLGIGIGSSGLLLEKNIGVNTYLHNNYAELLACGGLAGFLSYYSMYLHLAASYYQLRRNKDIYYPVSVILMVIFLAMDYGVVSYYSKGRYFYLMIFFLEARNLSKRKGAAKV